MITDNVVINKAYSWIDVEHLSIIDFDFLHSEYKLSSLLVQDCLRADHLPKFERTENGYFLMTRVFDPTSTPHDFTVQELTSKMALFITEERLITIHTTDLDFLKKFIEKQDRFGFPRNLQGLVHQLLKEIIYTYQEPLIRLRADYEIFQDKVLSRSKESLSNKKLYHFRRKIFVLKGILKQTTSAILLSKDFWKEKRSLLQDLKENIDQMYFELEDISHSFDQLYALHLSIANQHANEVMKVLTVFASLMLPLTFIASFYGMNFDYLPGAHSRIGLEVVSLTMVFISAVAIWYFKRKDWFAPQID